MQRGRGQIIFQIMEKSDFLSQKTDISRNVNMSFCGEEIQKKQKINVKF